MLIQPNEIQIWSHSLLEEESDNQNLLSLDEKVRAKSFRFDVHRRRFINARATLRKLIAYYLSIPPKEVVFRYTKHGKPFLLLPEQVNFSFNLSHSNDRVIYGFTYDHLIGVDIEKIQSRYNIAIAKRFFTLEENKALSEQKSAEDTTLFYRIWTRKEAMIKAIGEGLTISPATFSVLYDHLNATLLIDQTYWSLINLVIHSEYQAALATNQIIKQVSYWQLVNDQPSLMKTSTYPKDHKQ